MPPAADAVQTQAETGEARASAQTSSVPQTAPDQAATSARIAELRVSANLMTLETGIFCVFPAPGSPAPDPESGLPGVRITRCPGIAGKPEAISISTFRDDGWLDNTAALVRVTDGPAQVLVTIYQSTSQLGETAPRLQVLRLAGDPSMATAAEAPAPVPAAAQKNPDVMAHIQSAGDVPGQFGEWIGKRGSRMWVEGFGMSDKGIIPAGEMEYQGVLGKGWLSPWVENGKFCGSRGMALPLLGLNVRLKGESAAKYTVRYSASFVDGSAVGPVDEGTACEAPGLAALESFLVEIVPKSEPAETARPTPTRTPAARSPGRTRR